MASDFVKFPTTPHLLWLGTTAARTDKVLSCEEAEAFLRQPVIVEEKVDGANLGISFDSSGKLLAQNRGNFLVRETKDQFAPLWEWLSEREERLFDMLEDHFILFGEWCYARHSIHYTRLPDLFLAFDVFDKPARRFLNTICRDQLIQSAKLSTVPRVTTGVFQLAEVSHLIGESSLYDGPMEGVYLRLEDDSWLNQRAKIVCSEFTQQISEHWSQRCLVKNRRVHL